MNKTESEFDQQIIDKLIEIDPPEDQVSNINPWSKPIEFITWGLILTTLHLNFLYLQYLLPIIGVIMIFLGFRSLRNENKYFKILWIFSIVDLFLHIADIIKVITPISINDYEEIIIGTVTLTVRIIMFLVFHKALITVFKKAGKTMEGSPLIWASVWSIAAFLIAISPLSQSWLVFIPMVICYILIVRSLFSIGELLDDTGYVLMNAPVKVSNQTFGRLYFFIVLALVISCSIFFNHLKLEQKEYQQPDITTAREHLLEMKFPSDALQYLREEDVAIMEDAVNIEVSNKLLMLDPLKIEHREGTEGNMFITHTYEPGKKNIETATVYIEMPENVVYVMQYFNWVGGNPIWQDGLTITGDYDVSDKEIVSSALFYDKNNVRYIAEFPRLTCEEVKVNTMFGTHYSEPIAGALSFPFGSERQGGYVLYRYKVMTDRDDYITYATLNYIHRLSPIRIPYAKTEDLILNGAYQFIDELNQNYTTYESKAFKEKDE